ncbi:MAG: RHS repeat-associated core domain-containing protein [Thermogemmata sp.]|nr:RHS repeat-associated core domain-containing protein [Thermogemmata sp.]
MAWVYLPQGGRFDSTSSLYHFCYRDYTPTLGRWTSLDPLRYDAGDVNLYRTVFNAPTVYTDPSGQLPFLVVFALAAVGLGGGGTAVYTGIESYRTTGSVFNRQIWGAYGDGLRIGAQANVNALATTGRSFFTLGIWAEPWEVWAVADEDRPYYDNGFMFARFGWELLPTAGIGRLTQVPGQDGARGSVCPVLGYGPEHGAGGPWRLGHIPERPGLGQRPTSRRWPTRPGRQLHHVAKTAAGSCSIIHGACHWSI